MGTVVGNILALLFIFAAGVVGFISLQASTITFLVIAYGFWLVIFATNIFTTPAKDVPLCQMMQEEETDIYRRYHVFLWYPGAAQAYSAFLNGFRIAGFVWGGLCIWHQLYLLAAACVTYFFLTGGLILKLNPPLYMGAQAQKGNQVAMSHLSLIESVNQKREAYNSANEA